jgi:hypothetical protein
LWEKVKIIFFTSQVVVQIYPLKQTIIHETIYLNILTNDFNNNLRAPYSQCSTTDTNNDLQNEENSLPVKYYHSKHAWITQDIFIDWFHTHFVPTVRDHLTSHSIEPKCVLFLDCGVAHPFGLISLDGKIRCVLFPLDISTKVNPAERGLVTLLKCRYKIRFVERMARLTAELNLTPNEFMCAYTVRNAIYAMHEIWDGFEVDFLRAAWHKLNLNTDVSPFVESVDGKQLLLNFSTLGLAVDEVKLNDWLTRDDEDPGYGFYTDEDIVRLVMKSERPGRDDDESGIAQEEEDEYEKKEVGDKEDSFDFDNIDLTEICNFAELVDRNEECIVVNKRPVIGADKVIEYVDDIMNWLRVEASADSESLSSMQRIKDIAASRIQDRQQLEQHQASPEIEQIYGSETNQGQFSMGALPLTGFSQYFSSTEPTRSSITITKITK